MLSEYAVVAVPSAASWVAQFVLEEKTAEDQSNEFAGKLAAFGSPQDDIAGNRVGVIDHAPCEIAQFVGIKIEVQAVEASLDEDLEEVQGRSG